MTINPNTPCQFFLWEEIGAPGKKHNFPQSVREFFPRAIKIFDTGIEPMTSMVGSRCLNNRANEAPFVGQ